MLPTITYQHHCIAYHLLSDSFDHLISIYPLFDGIVAGIEQHANREISIHTRWHVWNIISKESYLFIHKIILHLFCEKVLMFAYTGDELDSILKEIHEFGVIQDKTFLNEINSLTRVVFPEIIQTVSTMTKGCISIQMVDSVVKEMNKVGVFFSFQRADPKIIF